MKGRKLSTREMAVRRREMLDTAFRLFSERNIDAVTLDEIAAETGYTKRSLLRYFSSKSRLVIETATWAFKQFIEENRSRSPVETGTAAEGYAFFIDSFLRLYRERRDLLRFNQFFNIYIQSQRVDAEQMQPYSGMIETIHARFHAIYEKGRQDRTLRTDVSEEEMFSATLHLMLAVVTRYAVGLVYQGGVDPEQELLTQRDMLLREYTTTA